MITYQKGTGLLIQLGCQYPILDEEDNFIGNTSIGDMAVITYADGNGDGYFEIMLVSGKYIGIDSLALNWEDIVHSKVVVNEITGHDIVYIKDRKMNVLIVKTDTEK